MDGAAASEDILDVSAQDGGDVSAQDGDVAVDGPQAGGEPAGQAAQEAAPAPDGGESGSGKDSHHQMALPSEEEIKAAGRISPRSIILFAAAVVLGIGGLLLSLKLYDDGVKANREEADRLEAEARETKTVEASSLYTADLNADDGESRDGLISFNLFTKPQGADVYANGDYIGTTPVESKRLPKTADVTNFVIILDGYQIMRRDIILDKNFSDVVSLDKIVVVKQTSTSDDDITKGVKANKAVVVIGAPSKRGKKKGKDAAAEIVLPD